MNDLKRCDYCELMFKHIVILRNKLMEPQLQSSDRDATILELKSYYWLTRTYYQKFLKQCNCEYKNKFEQTLKYLLEVFKENDVKLDSDKAKCDICKILPCELFPLLDKACTIYVQHDLELMCVELQYYIFLSFIFQEMIEQCTLCDEFVDYKACIEAACTYLFNKDIHQL